MISLGIDIGSSSVKAALLDIKSGACVGSFTSPSVEMKIDSPQKGWAEQSPMMWWENIVIAVKEAIRKGGISSSDVVSIGITYQMHGLVVVDSFGEPLRKSIIWCDSRAVEIGRKAFKEIGSQRALKHLLNSPGNFTASKLAWVKRNEPELFAKVDKFMLPGDFVMYMLSGDISTTKSGLSEQIMWDFIEERPANFVSENYGIPSSMIPSYDDSIGVQATLKEDVAKVLGLTSGIPIAYRAGDQPNNAFSLNVLNSGEIAATGGTSGVIYGVTDVRKADPLSRVNTFLHVNHKIDAPRYGVLLCINGTGIANSWMKHNMAQGMDYPEINNLAMEAPVASDGVSVIPFGNGAERVLENRSTGMIISGVDLNRHNKAHVLRAVQEGIAFAFRYGLDVMRESGINASVMRAGEANMFLSPLFRQTLANICDVKIELYNTDGALGAARGAALGAGFYKNEQEAFASLKKVGEVTPCHKEGEILKTAYTNWKNILINS